VQMGRAALPLPGNARLDWQIIQEIAQRIGLDWRYTHPRDVFAEMKLAMPSLDNITWERLEREDSVTYPCDAPDKPGNEIVFGDGFPTPSGRAKLVPAAIIPPAEEPDGEYPMVLTTGAPACSTRSSRRPSPASRRPSCAGSACRRATWCG
jgi:formate dehydrogenase major subunit